MKIKRYQSFTKNGIEWSKWFPWNGKEEEKWQLKNKLKNEYKQLSEKEWLSIQKEQDNNV